ncbi:hypothetical protein L484_016105 [Morus notabilis]|uniref:Uncharacterized protein n=1 Tax=Morus notabilis TaxID=981085 RepID=W9S174_9ROSA|nr:hypothetical protein L484_016105 [Morus notabilis]
MTNKEPTRLLFWKLWVLKHYGTWPVTDTESAFALRRRRAWALQDLDVAELGSSGSGSGEAWLVGFWRCGVGLPDLVTAELARRIWVEEKEGVVPTGEGKGGMEYNLLLKLVFWPIDHEIILGIPLSQGFCHGQLVWHSDSKGMDSVRSGYKLAMNHREGLLGSSGRQISMLYIAKIMDATFSRFVAECFAIREGLLVGLLFAKDNDPWRVSLVESDSTSFQFEMISKS